MKVKGLGKGLEALFSEETLETDTPSQDNGVMLIPIENIETNSNQPRKNFSSEKLEELAKSIQEHGIIQPIIVKHKDNGYQIIAGERRFRAARMAHLTQVPVIVKEVDNQLELELALIENIQREDLNVMELEQAYRMLIDEYKLTQIQLSERIGKGRSTITHILRLNELSPYVQEKLREDDENFRLGHAKVILGIKDQDVQNILTDKVIEEELSVRALEKFIASMNKEKKPKAVKETSPFHKEIQEKLQVVFGTKVKLSQKDDQQGKIEIEYYNDEDLERILSALKTTDKE